ncbi:hypothetical protein LguiB_028443 [Lonicera macranthoides]
MPERNDVSCSAMETGYISNDCSTKAIELFCEMKSRVDDVSPIGLAINGTNETACELFVEMEKRAKSKCGNFVGIRVASNHKTLMNNSLRPDPRLDEGVD